MGARDRPSPSRAWAASSGQGPQKGEDYNPQTMEELLSRCPACSLWGFLLLDHKGDPLGQIGDPPTRFPGPPPPPWGSYLDQVRSTHLLSGFAR